MRTKCATCDEPKVGCLFCGRCGEAFDRWNRKSDGDIAEVIEWAAERARRMERRRVAAEAKR